MALMLLILSNTLIEQYRRFIAETPESHTDTLHSLVGEVVATEGDQNRSLPHREMEIIFCL
jgi:hypothetical protein